VPAHYLEEVADTMCDAVRSSVVVGSVAGPVVVSTV